MATYGCQTHSTKTNHDRHKDASTRISRYRTDMNRKQTAFSLLVSLLLSGCASTRILRVENRLLERENEALELENSSLRDTQLDPKLFTKRVTLSQISALLKRSGYEHEFDQTKQVIRLKYTGKSASFGLNIQHYEKAQVLYIATNNYFSLDHAQNTSSVVLLAIKLMALNYEMLLGKFQMNPESGAILLSTEVYVGDGLGHATLLQALDHLCRVAEEKLPELTQAASGVGL